MNPPELPLGVLYPSGRKANLLGIPSRKEGDLDMNVLHSEIPCFVVEDTSV